MHDRVFKILLKLRPRTKVAGNSEVEEGKIFRQIVLNGCTGQEDASLDVDRVESGVGLVLAVLKPVRLVAQQKSDGCVAELVR